MPKRWEATVGSGMIIGFLVSLLSIGACAPAPEAEEEGLISLTLAGYQAPEHVISEVELLWVERVEEETNGRVKVEVHQGEELCKAGEMHELASKGTIDIGCAWTSYAAGHLPFCGDMCMLPFAWHYPEDHLEALDRGIYDLVESEHNDLNLHVLWAMTSYGQEWFFQEPLRTLEDMKGLKCRSTGALADLFIEGLGMTPVTMATPEIYMAASRGLIDAISHSYVSYFVYKEYEVCPYIVSADTWSQNGFAVMNLDVWNSLDQDTQDIMTRASAEVGEWGLQEDKRRSLELIEEYQGKGTVDFYELPADERARWVEAAAGPFYEEFMRKWGDRGKQVVEIVNSFYKEYGLTPIPIP